MRSKLRYDFAPTEGSPSRPDPLSGAGARPDLSRRLEETLELLARQMTSLRNTEDWIGAGPTWPGEPGSPAIAAALCTLEGRFIEVNDALVSLSGYSRDEIVGRTGAEFGLWTDPEELLRGIRQRGACNDYVLAYRTRAGQTRRMTLAARIVTVNGRGCVLAVGADMPGRPGFDYEATL